MAARENQGYVIGIIVLAVLSVMLLVTTVFSTMKAYENYDKVVAAEETARNSNALADANAAKANMFAAMIGVEGKVASEIKIFRDLITTAKSKVSGSDTAKIQTIVDAANGVYAIYEKDMAFNRAISDENDEDVEAETYKGTVDKMASALRASNENARSSSVEAERIRNESDQKIAAISTRLQERSDALDKTQQDLADEKQRNARKEAELQEVAKSIQVSMENLGDEFENEKDTLEDTIAKRDTDLEYVVKQNTAMKNRLDEYEKPVFDLADGEIVQVSESSHIVFIDLGQLDGVRANLTFAVYDRTANDFKKDRHKATIEVIEVIGPHLAKARVTDEDPLNPILSKDQILSATFDRGDAVTIALGGFFDLDGDGLSDVEKLKRMIVRNGGRVVASHDDAGNITGEIDSTTRFFVLGPSPRTGTANVISAIVSMKEQAEGNSVDIIDLRKLLNWMGAHGNAKIERLDNRIGESTGFQQRSPADK